MSNVINVLFSSMKGSKHTVPVKDDHTFDNIKKIINDNFNIKKFRLIVNGQGMRDDDSTKFSELKKSIKNNTIIYVCPQMDHDSDGRTDLDSFYATIIPDLQDKLRKVPTLQTLKG